MGIYSSLLTVEIQLSTVLTVAIFICSNHFFIGFVNSNHWGNGSLNILVCRISCSSLILHHLVVFGNLQCH